ncbi:MAG: pyridoxamine 5'-phosphate oxidase family protein [Anaerolineae bacterium]|nr:pyridoxamine 5'-phosphate oxidase family protein [Anaerolineae bacterium]
MSAMRRADREISDRAEIEAIIAEARVCHLGLCDGAEPYVVPVSFGYLDGSVYIHSARQGRKLDLLRRNPQACVEFALEDALRQGERACDWGLSYRSVIGWGRAALIEDPEAKAAGLNAIMAHYGGAPEQYTPAELDRVALIRIDLERIRGKRAG